MSESQGPLPILPHLTSEFFLWIWWKTEEKGGVLNLGDPVGDLTIWVDERLAFRSPGETKLTTIVSGEKAAEALEAKAALYGGKVLQQLRLHIQRMDREFGVLLNGPDLTMTQMKLPQVVQDTEEEAIYDRMFLYSELCFILKALWNEFGTLRNGPDWAQETVPAIQSWLEGDS
jgi:hypothetical protein